MAPKKRDPEDMDRLTPFMLFMVENKAQYERKHPSLGPAELSRLVYEAWKALTPEQSRAYSVLSAAFAEKRKTSPIVRKKRAREKDPQAPKAGEQTREGHPTTNSKSCVALACFLLLSSTSMSIA